MTDNEKGLMQVRNWQATLEKFAGSHFCSSERRTSCIEHRKLREYFCSDCSELICSKCIVGTHQNHTYRKANQISLPESLVGRLRTDLIQPASECLTKVESSVAQLTQDSEAIEANRNICAEAIRDTFNNIRAAINTREAVLLEAVDKYIDSKLSQVEERSERCLEMREQIIQALARVEMLLSDTVTLCDLNLVPTEIDKLAEELDFYQQSAYDVECDMTDCMFSSTYIGFGNDNIKPIQQQVGSLISLCEYFPDADSGYYLSRKIDEEEEEDLYVQTTQYLQTNKLCSSTDVAIRQRSLSEHCEGVRASPNTLESGDESNKESLPNNITDESSLLHHSDHISLMRTVSMPVVQTKQPWGVSTNNAMLPPVPIRFDSLLLPTPIVQPHKVFDKLSRLKTEVVQPCGVCIGENNCILVSDVKNHCLRVIASNGKFIDTIGSEGRGSGEFEEPCGLAVDKKMNILVTQKENSRVQKLSPSGKPIGRFGQKTHRGRSLGESWGIAVGLDNKVFVTDWDRNCIHVFSSSGRYLRSFGGESSGIEESLKLPAGITFSRSGHVLVVDRGNHCVWMLGAHTGSIQLRIGSKGQGPGELYYPFGVASNNGLVFVSESGNNRISVFSSTGTFVRHFGRKGALHGMFDHPRHLCISPNGELIVADELNHRLQLFRL